MTKGQPEETDETHNQNADKSEVAKPESQIEKVLLFNDTDGILVHPSPVTRCSALRLIRQFRGRFREQGFYLTAQRERIAPDEVRLSVTPASGKHAGELEPVEFEEE